MAGLANVGFAAFFLPAGTFAAAVSWAVLSTGVLGRRFGLGAAFVAAVSLAASIGALTASPRWLAGGGLLCNLALVSFFVWLLVLAVLFLRAPAESRAP